MTDDFDTFWIKRNPPSHTHTHTHARMHATYTHIHTHIHTHTYTYTYTHTHTPRNAFHTWHFFRAVHDSFLMSSVIPAERVIKVNFKRYSCCKTRIDIDNQGFSLLASDVNRIETSRINKNSWFLVIWYSRFYFGVSVAHLWHLDFLLDGS